MVAINTKFSLEARGYVLSYARDEGRLVSGLIDQIMIKIGEDGTSIPAIFYRMTQTIAFVPPGGYWMEYELGTEQEATVLSNAYNTALADAYRRKVSP